MRPEDYSRNESQWTDAYERGTDNRYLRARGKPELACRPRAKSMILASISAGSWKSMDRDRRWRPCMTVSSRRLWSLGCSLPYSFLVIELDGSNRSKGETAHGEDKNRYDESQGAKGGGDELRVIKWRRLGEEELKGKRWREMDKEEGLKKIGQRRLKRVEFQRSLRTLSPYLTKFQPSNALITSTWYIKKEIIQLQIKHVW